MEPLWVRCMGEMVGTLLLVFLGNGIGFSVSHKKMFANQSGKWILIAFGWAAGLFISVMTAMAIGAPGHLNPAVSLMFCFKDVEVLSFIPMQFLGAVLGQSILYGINWNFIVQEANDVDGNKSATRAATCTNPAIDGKKAYLYNFLYELIATFILLLMIFITLYGKIAPIYNAYTPVFVTVAILSILISIGSATGAAVNPARDLGPRIVYQLVLLTQKNKSLVNANWQYSWIPVCAPLIPGIIFGVITLAY